MSSLAGATGILGGTFDPPHLGHVEVAAQCQRLLDLAEVRLVPSSVPPHRAAPVASPTDRLAMVELAVGGREGLVVDDIEVRRGGVSFTVDTLEAMRREGRRLVLLLGHDAALELAGWHRGQDIPGLADVVVFNRGTDGGGDDIPGNPRVIEVDSPPVSATEVRRRLAAGEDVAGMLPPAVLGYIREQGLYVTAK